MSRHQQPHHTLSFLACLHEICSGATVEAAATSEEAAAVAKQLTALQTNRVMKRRALKIALHAATQQKRKSAARQQQQQQVHTQPHTRTDGMADADQKTAQGADSSSSSTAEATAAGGVQQSAALKYFTERAARKKQRRAAVAAAAAASIPGTQPTENVLDSSESELDSDSEPEELDEPALSPLVSGPILTPVHTTAASDTAETATISEDVFVIPPQVIVSAEQKAAMDQRFRRLHGAALVASSVAEASSPLMIAPVLQVGSASCFPCSAQHQWTLCTSDLCIKI